MGGGSNFFLRLWGWWFRKFFATMGGVGVVLGGFFVEMTTGIDLEK